MMKVVKKIGLLKFGSAIKNSNGATVFAI